MDFEYYGISKEVYDRLIADRHSFITDYWRDGRHFSKHKSKDRGFSSRVLDKNIYENLLNSFYIRGNSHHEYQGVFNGYKQSEFISIHLESKYVLKVDFKNCYRNITFDHFKKIIEEHSKPLYKPLPIELVRSLYFPNNYLQAGLSASNIICDLVLKYNFDKQINCAIHRKGVRLANYSRYYDDLHISSDDIDLLKRIYELIKNISKDLSLPLNYKKGQMRRIDGVKMLGSRISNGAIRIPRAEKNNLRAAIYQLENTNWLDKEYEHRLRSVIYRVVRICNIEEKVNSKYSEYLDYFTGRLDELVQENYDNTYDIITEI